MTILPTALLTDTYRGIAIVVSSKPGLNHGSTYVATAGGRSFIAASLRTREDVLITAKGHIDGAASYAPEKMALWLNDTAHWKAERQVERVAEIRREIEALEALRERLSALYEGQGETLRTTLYNASYSLALAVKALDRARDLIADGKA